MVKSPFFWTLVTIGFCKKGGDKEKDTVEDERSLRSGPKMSFKEAPFSSFSSGPEPVKSGRVVSGPIFDGSVWRDCGC